jgi:hypothetical protein
MKATTTLTRKVVVGQLHGARAEFGGAEEEEARQIQ